LDAKLAFWAIALANMGIIVVLVARGVRAIRRNDVATHQASMKLAGVLVVGFLVAYVFKRGLLGGEDLVVWGTAARANLYVHETFVTTMLVVGLIAFRLGRGLARTRRVTGASEDPPPTPAQLRRHRRAGWIAVIAVGGGFLTACGVLAGMIARAG
jgi:uncharacterized membrane protein YozB (DUF420 family)